MALNKSVGTGVSGRKTGNAATRASGIPSAMRIAKSSENSSDGPIKIRIDQPSDGKIGDGTTQAQRSLTKERTTIPGKIVSSSVGSGGEADMKQNTKSVTSASLSAHSTTVNGVIPSLAKAAQKLDRSSPKVASLTDANSANDSEAHCKPESTFLMNHHSSLPMAVSKVDRVVTKKPSDSSKTGGSGTLVSKRSPPGSAGSRGVTQASVAKAKSPSPSCRNASETGGKTDAHARKTTGIAKLQNPSSSARPLKVTNQRPRSSPSSSSIPSSRATSSLRAAGFGELGTGRSTGGKTDEPIRRDIRAKVGYRLDISGVCASGGNRKTASTAKIPKSYALNGISLKNSSIHELRSVIHSSQDTISKNFEDTVENTSECEYFSETKSNISENMSDLGDDNISLDWNFTDLEAEKLSALTEMLDASTAQLVASTEDIFASCEDMLCTTTGDDEESSVSDLLDVSKLNNLLPVNNESSDLQTDQKSQFNVADKTCPEENETELFIEEETLHEDLEIVEDDQFAATTEDADCDLRGKNSTNTDSNPSATNITDISTRNNDDADSNSRSTTVCSNSIDIHELEEPLVSSVSNSADAISHTSDDFKSNDGVNNDLSANKDGFDSEMNCDTKRDIANFKVSPNLNSNSGDVKSDNASVSAVLENVQNAETSDLNPVKHTELQIQNTTGSPPEIKSTSAASANLVTVPCMERYDEQLSALSDSSSGDVQSDLCSNSCVIRDGFGADGTANSEEVASPGCSAETRSDFQGHIAAAASGGEGKDLYEVDRNRGRSNRIVLGDSCETLKCDYESDADAENASSRDADGVCAAGTRGCTAVNKGSKCSHGVTGDRQTDFPCKLVKCQKFHNNKNVPVMLNTATADLIQKDSSVSSDVEIPKDVCIDSSNFHQENMLDEISGAEVGEECQDDGEKDRLLLATRGALCFCHDNCSDVGPDVKLAAEIKDNNTLGLDSKQYFDDVGGFGQLSACFIKEFSAWLPDSASESRLKHVPGYKFSELNDDDIYQFDVSDASSEENLFNINNMNRRKDLRLFVPNKGREVCETRKVEAERTCPREVPDSSIVLGGEDSSSSAQMGLDAAEPSSTTTLTEFSLVDQSGSQSIRNVSNSMAPVASSNSHVIDEQRQKNENLETCSSIKPTSVRSCTDAFRNKSAPLSDKSKEITAIQNSNKDSASSGNETSGVCRAKMENCTRSSDGASFTKAEEKDLETRPNLNSSIPLSLCYGSSTKELNHLVQRAPSPLSVLTDPYRSEESDRDRKSTAPAEIPLLNICRFRPVAVKDYFAVGSNDSLNAAQQRAEKETELQQSNPDKVIKDANHNVVGKTSVASVTAEPDRAVTPEIHGFMSPKYLPSRPLSQICTRTMGRSLHRNIGCIDGSNNSSLTSIESLPTSDSVLPEKQASVLAQIHFARSCSRIGLVKSPSLMQSDCLTDQSCSTPRMPVAGSLPSFELYHGSSGKTLKPGTPYCLSQAGASRHLVCHTPVIGEGSSPCATPSRVSTYDSASRDASRNGTPIPRLHEDVHGSAASLTSVSSSVYSTSVDEKQAMEIRKLKLELEAARETVVSLTTQLNVNALMSKTYEQNIEGLTQRLKQLTTIIDQKESELCELRPLKNASQSSSDGCGSSGLQTIPDCVSVSSSLHRRASNSASLPYEARSAGLKYHPVLTRHISCESVNSLNSQSSSCSMGSQQSATIYSEIKKKKKNWIRSSFSKAFSRKKNKPGSVGEADSLSLQSDTSANESLVVENQVVPVAKSLPSEGSRSPSDSIVMELEEKLREADRHLTDLRLDSLASIQHIEQLQETISCLEQQVATLKSENKTLQRRLLEQGTSPTSASMTNNQKRAGDLMRHGSLRSSPPSNAMSSSCSTGGLSRLTTNTSHEMSSPKLLQRFSLVDAMASDASCDQLRRVAVFVTTDSCDGEETKVEEESTAEKSRQIGILMLSEQASWQDLDMRLCSLFVEHIHVLDPDAGLGLDERSIASYQLGSQERIPNSKMPDIIPSKVLTTANASIKIRLRDWQEDCVDFLAFDTLVPKPLLIQYVSLLTENRRLLFCGPNLSGKTFLAKKLARHLVLRKEKRLSSVSIAHFTVDSKSSKELQQYLSNIVNHCERGSDRLPSVIVIDNLHLADNLSKAFSGFFSLSSQSCPYLVGTMTQSRAASITCLQFHQNFRWVLFSLTEDPVKSFLARYLHRQWAEKQFRQSGSEDGDCGLLRVVDWMPKVWQHVNRFVASVCCPDKCIGPGIFLSCPMDVDKARTWFVDLWNYSIGPYLLQLIKDSSIQSGSNRAAREDPTDWVLETSPWESNKSKGSETRTFPLLRLFTYNDSSLSREQNQALSSQGKQFLPNSSSQADPLLDMLLHLQVSTCYSDSNTTPTILNQRYAGLNTTSPKIGTNPNSLHSAAS